MDTEEALSRFEGALSALDQGRPSEPMVFWGLSGSGRTETLRRMFTVATKLSWTAVVAEEAFGDTTAERVRMGFLAGVDKIRVGRPGSLTVRSVGEELATASGRLSVGAMVRLVGTNIQDMRARLCLFVDDLEPSAEVAALVAAAAGLSERSLPLLVVCCLSAPMELDGLDGEIPELARLGLADVRSILSEAAGGSAQEPWVLAAAEVTGRHADLVVRFAGLLGEGALAAPVSGDVERLAERFRSTIELDLHSRVLVGLDRADRRFLKGLIDLGGRQVPLRAVAQRIGDVTPLRRDTGLTEERAASLAERGLVALNGLNEVWVNPPYLVNYGAALD